MGMENTGRVLISPEMTAAQIAKLKTDLAALEAERLEFTQTHVWVETTNRYGRTFGHWA